VLAQVRSSRLSHATVVAYLALFVALGGSSYAAITVSGKNVKDGSLTGKDVKNHSLATKNLSKGTVKSLSGQAAATGPQGPNGAPGTPAPTNAITGANVVDNSLTTADLAGAAQDGAVSLSGIANGRCTQVTFSVSGAQVGDTQALHGQTPHKPPSRPPRSPATSPAQYPPPGCGGLGERGAGCRPLKF